MIDIDGDGSFLMNIQELACAHVEGIAAKALILNNQHLGMVVQWEDRFFAATAATLSSAFSPMKPAWLPIRRRSIPTS